MVIIQELTNIQTRTRR